MITGRFIATLAAAAAVVSCHSHSSKLDRLNGETSSEDEPGGTAAGSAKTPAEPKRTPVTAEQLQPLIHELGDDKSVPTSVVIELAAPIIDRGTVGASSPQSVVKITPEIPGRLAYTNVSELTFTPARPFAFDTEYTVELQKLDTRDGIVEPRANQKWTHSFKTPPFAFLSWAPTAIDMQKHTLDVEIVFSGPVLPNLARQAMAITLDNHAPQVSALASHSPNIVALRLTDAKLAMGSKVALATKATLPSVLGTYAPAATAAFTVNTEKVVTIKNAYMVEGATGFYMEVVCNDGAAPAGHRYSYDGQGYYDLSERCQLSDEALSRFHFTPAVKKPYITNGRAGFRVFGDFQRGTYDIKIDGGAPSVDGGIMLAPFSKSLSVSARKPQLAFAGSGRYLPRTAWTNLGVKHLNVDKAELTVRQVPPENLIFYLSDDNSDGEDERTSNLLMTKTIPLRGDPDQAATDWVDMSALLPSTTKGVLELTLGATGATATSRLLLTNMSLVAKKVAPAGKPWDQRVRVWALDIETAKALDGVEVSLVRKSGRVVAKCTTSGDAGCMLDSTNDTDPDSAEPFALIAHKGDDLTYIRYADLKADVAESQTSGAPYVLDVPYRAAMYSDRGVYRPGETAHVTAIVRDAKDRAPDAALPVDAVVFDPKAKVVRKLALKTNAAGMVEVDQAFPVFADTGHWRVSFSVADKSLGEYDVEVEEFVPERMKVTLAPKKPDVLTGDKLDFNVSAVYLFGGTASNSGVELSCTASPSRFEPSVNTDFTYGVTPRGKEVNLGDPTKDQLDTNGALTLACPDPASKTAFTRTTQITATASVLEAGSGRATVASSTLTSHPEKFYLGLKTKTEQAVSGDRFGVDGIVVDWQGKPVAATKQIEVQLLHLEYDYGYAYNDDSGDDSYNRYMRRVPEGKLTAQVDATGHFHFDVSPGEADIGYIVRATAGNAKTELELPGSYPYDYYYAYNENGRVDRTPRPAKATQLPIKIAKEIEIGKPVPVSVATPYRGRILWTVETDRLVTYAWQDVTSGTSEWSFTLDKFVPNVYVSAFLVKDPHVESKDAFLPDRAFGIAPVRVLPTEQTQPVKIIAPKEVRSSSQLQVTLDIGAPAGPTFATIAVVDEGILSLTHFKTPDPLTELFARRALGVETYETIGWTMLHNPAGASSRTGGGDESGEGGEGALGKSRVQPIKPVALFSGIVAVGADGKITVPFQIPSYRGQVRVMAIVAGPTKIGRAEADVTVRDPLVVQVTFPRFVTQNDEIQIPVFLTNMSGGPLQIAIKLDSVNLPIPGLVSPKQGTPPLTFMGKATGTMQLDNGRNDTIVFQAKAMIPVGGATLRVVAKAGNLEVSDTVDVPFLPAGPKERVVQKLKLAPGLLDLAAQPALKNWLPTSESTTFWISANPYGESFQNLDYLIHYPYGCIEQTTSTVRPLLYVANLAEQVDPKLAELKIEDMVLSGINRIFTMETPSGGFGYWPGATEPLEWATAYATDMLIDAKKAGYAVPDDRMKAVLAWIDGRVTAYERGQKIAHEPWNYYDEQSEAYLHYVLARAGKGHKARILKLIGDIPAKATGERLEDRYLLEAALYLAGDRRYASDLKAVDASPIAVDRVNSWSFYSDRRRRGLELSVFFDLFGADPAGEPLANRVAEMLAGEPAYYYNTQELVWGVTGLGKWVGAIGGKGTAGGKLTADGQLIAARTTKQKSNDKVWSLARASEYKALTLDVPDSANGMWLIIAAEGVHPGATYKVGGNGLAVTRSYHQLDSTELKLSDGSVHLGDLVFVEIELENTSGQYIQNLALVDRLPAGFEIENPRLGRTTKPDWVKDEEQWPADFMNMRDDRIEAFGALAGHSSKKVVYTIRAVTAGKFAIPPLELGAMYDPTLWARTAAETAVIGGPWTSKLQ